MDDTEASTTEDVEESPPAKHSRGWIIAATLAVLAAATSVGILGSLLFGGPSQQVSGKVLACVPSRDFTKNADKSKGDTCPPAGATYTDGLVGKTGDGTFTLRTIMAGQIGKSVKLHVRKPDQVYIDVQHAQTHAALGQPVRVYTRKYKGQEIVVYMVDSPLLK